MTLSNVATRVLVGILFGPLVLGITYVGGLFFLAFVLLVVYGGLWEFYQMARCKGAFPNVYGGIFGAVAGNALLFFVPAGPWVGLCLFLSLGAILALEIWRPIEGSALLNLSMTVLGLAYVGGLTSYLLRLRALPVYGAAGMALAFAIAWSCDVAAYFVGKCWGHHRLIPRVSAAKTVEGSVAGMVFPVFVLFGLRAGLWPWLAVVDCLILGLVGSMVGQLGDLVESWMKRDAAIKDSSHAIPGHGGVLDRFDSLLFVAPFVYYYWIFVMG